MTKRVLSQLKTILRKGGQNVRDGVGDLDDVAPGGALQSEVCNAFPKTSVDRTRFLIAQPANVKGGAASFCDIVGARTGSVCFKDP